MRGGPRPGSGRPRGSVSKATEYRQAKVAAGGATPLDIMVEAMRFFRGQAALAQQQNPPDITAVRIWLMAAAKIANDAAPYVHPKLAAVQVSGDPDNPLTMVNRIERVIISQIEDLTNQDAEGVSPAH